MKINSILYACALALTTIYPVPAQFTGSTVYSTNAVGYRDFYLSGGFHMIANPFKQADGDINTFLPLPDSADSTTVYRYKPAVQAYGDMIQFISGWGWYTPDPDPNFLIFPPGEGFWIQPSAPSLNFSIVGDVRATVSVPLPVNYSIVAPPAGLVISDLTSFPARDGDTIHIFDSTTQQYKDSYSYFDGYGWFSANADDPGPQGPAVAAGQSFFLWRDTSQGASTWTQTGYSTPRIPPYIWLSDPVRTGAGFSFRFYSGYLGQHNIEFKETLSDPWQVLDIVDGTGSDNSFVDYTGAPCRVYRVVYPYPQ